MMFPLASPPCEEHENIYLPLARMHKTMLRKMSRLLTV
ncbi:hypothetical protein EG68_08055 [Paragonimus skrjabini miyazakii]|uniref:Uncharacterized protein n=1 Tax=Paragonimus skrjabini miyazakii TaxID=59628 RepID=A0A8S9YI89_9TREM|nr:hypothetical protein EG68_08055 [Paragonimus skrjabini miyazakii]